MKKNELNPLHEIAKLEHTFKFLYFLRDLGIQTAHREAEKTWTIYMMSLNYIISNKP